MARFEMASAEMASMAELQPNADGLFELGMIYSTGRDVGADLVAAHKWFNLAAAAVAEALRAAREWLSTH
jgi:TPR repeat protein